MRNTICNYVDAFFKGIYRKGVRNSYVKFLEKESQKYSKAYMCLLHLVWDLRANRWDDKRQQDEINRVLDYVDNLTRDH